MARQKTSIEDSVADADVLSNSRIHLASHKSIEIKKSSVLFLFTRMERTLTVNSERHLLGWVLMMARTCRIEFGFLQWSSQIGVGKYSCYSVTRLRIIVVVAMRTLLWILLIHEDGEWVKFGHRRLRQVLLRLCRLLYWMNIARWSVSRRQFRGALFRLSNKQLRICTIIYNTAHIPPVSKIQCCENSS